METTYTVKSKKDGYKWMFTYKETGKIKTFELGDYELSESQETWLSGHFPINEKIIIGWITKLAVNFEIKTAPSDITFDSFWKKYNYKKGLKEARIKYDKLTDFQKQTCFEAVKKYDKHLFETKQAKAHLATWIHNERFNDEY
jgi:hypothetical protein